MAREPQDANIPAEVYPLASFLCEEMQARGWKDEDVAVRMGGKNGEEIGRDLLMLALILCVHRDNCVIDDATFTKLAGAFGVSPGMFKYLDATWRQWPDHRVPFEPPESIFGQTSRNSIRTPH